MIVKALKKQGLIVNKNYDKKKKSEQDAHSGINQIYTLLDKVGLYEEALGSAPNSQIVQHLIMLYNKVIEYYSALNDERHLEYLQKLQKLFQDNQVQRLMDISDQGGDINVGAGKRRDTARYGKFMD